jgi:hypothetical protein
MVLLMKRRQFGQTKLQIANSQEVGKVEKNEKYKQADEKSRLEHTSQTAKKETTVKSEKLRYKNADSIYDI